MKHKRNYKLIHLLDLNGYTLRMLEKLLGLSYSGLHYKIIGRSPFTAREIAIIQKTFNLSFAEVEEIFLKDEINGK